MMFHLGLRTSGREPAFCWQTLALNGLLRPDLFLVVFTKNWSLDFEKEGRLMPVVLNIHIWCSLLFLPHIPRSICSL